MQELNSEVAIPCQSTTFEFTDRYSATGAPRPTEDSCHFCDAMGCIPVHRNAKDPALQALWEALDARRRTFRGFMRQLIKSRDLSTVRYHLRELRRNGIRNWGCDEWHFVICPHCNGKPHPNSDYRVIAD